MRSPSADLLLRALAALLLSLQLLVVSTPAIADSRPPVNPARSLRQTAHAHGVNGLELLRALDLPLSAAKDRPLRELGVDEARLAQALRHVQGEGEGSATLKYWFWPPLILFALWWLFRGGRPRGGKPTRAYPKWVFHTGLAVTVVVFGFALGKSPNPMEGLVKAFKAGAGLYPDLGVKLLLLLFFSVLAVVGTKLICGWGCPFGALQELLYELPILRRAKAVQLPFAVTMAVRTLLFLLFLVLLFGLIGAGGTVIYHYLNPFNLFDLEFVLPTVTLSIGAFLLLSLAVYRPFCQVVCPFGWYSCFLEKISLFGIRVNRRRCTRCFACARACPLEAARGRVEGWALPADCFSCARCLRICPAGALDYGPRWRRPEA